MKKICLTAILFISCLASANPTSFDFSLRNSQNGTSLVMETSTARTKFLISLSQDKDGIFTLKTPPSFCISWEPYLLFGELKPSGIVKLALDPSDTDSGLSGFNQKRFDTVAVPALHPEYSGIVIPFENLDIFSFAPVLNPGSPLAFGTNISFRNCFFSGILYDSSHIEKDTSDKYQTDWQVQTKGNEEMILLAGAVSSNKLNKININTQSFIHIADNYSNGIRLSTGADINLRINKCNATLKKRYSSKVDKSLFVMQLHNFAEITVMDCIYTKPIYGGLYQKRDISLKAEIKGDSFTFSSNKKLSVSENGTVRKTDSLKLAFKEFDCKIVLRTDINEVSLESWSLSYSDGILKSEFSDKGLTMSISKRIQLSEKSRIIISLNQDRMLSINYSAEN